MIVSPGASSTPAIIEPNITVLAPATNAFTMSPEYRIPPSAIIGTFVPFNASTTLNTAESCGTPTPATIRVVQIDPGPIPTFTASAPASTNANAALPVAIFPAITSTSGNFSFTFATVSITPLLCP